MSQAAIKTIERSANFDLLRLIAALMVLCSHQFALNGFPEPYLPYFGSWGSFGVMIFFALSGYLNGKSIFRTRSARTFIYNRALRIIPGLIACSIFCIILGAFVTTYSLDEYLIPDLHRPLSAPAPLLFLLKNSFPVYRMGTDLPGVFLSNHFPKNVNGSLWTLPYEVKCYLILAALSAIAKFNKTFSVRALLGFFFGISAIGFLFSLDNHFVEERLIKFIVVFAMGVCAALVEIKIGKSRALAFGVIVPVLLALSSNPMFAALTCVTVGILAFNRLPLPSFIMPKIDISYGIYIYAFPVQQYVSTLNLNWYLNFGIVLLATIALGLLSAVLVERPALRWKIRSLPSKNRGVHSDNLAASARSEAAA